MYMTDKNKFPLIVPSMDVITLVLVVTGISATTAYVIENPTPYDIEHFTPSPTISKCLWNGTIYNDGEKVALPCKGYCYCGFGRMVCAYGSTCPAQHQYTCVDEVPNDCGCHSCPNGPNCRIGNSTVPLGQDYRLDERTICRCRDGGGPPICRQFGCTHGNVTTPFGQEYRLDERTICRCEYGGGPPICRPFGCVYQGKVYSGGTFHPSPCEVCQCDPHSYVLHCSLNSCVIKSLLCVDAIVEPGTCCHVCPNGPNCFVGNKKIPAGQDYNDGSQICRCPEPNNNLHFGSSGPQAVCTLVGPMAPPSTTNP